MAGNAHHHGKGWPLYGSDRKKNPPANYRPRKREYQEHDMVRKGWSRATGLPLDMPS